MPSPRRRRHQIRIGIDTGGTFTDFVVGAADRRVRVHKVLSTPDDPARAVLQGLAELFPDGWDGEVTYGSTVATNALLERRGARVALLTTAGFEDVLEIGRQARPDLYALEPRVPAPLVGREDRIGVRERIGFDGAILTPLAATEIRRVLALLRQRRPEAIAVVLLHAYAEPRHERAIGRALARLGVPVTLSHALVREHREYERTSTAVVNAYVAPVMSRHLGRLARAMPRGRLRIMQSNGGAVSPVLAAREPVRTILSGPAGGVVGAARLAAAAGVHRLLTFDMGGTSTDVAMIDGVVPRRSDWTLDRMALRVPVIDIHTVGAGGGSVARRDPGGSLQVGPESAGADPGPACYGRSTVPTVTDANLVLGRLDANAFLGGHMTLDVARARDAVARLARELRLDVARTAEGIVTVVNAAMARALRVISVERGYDPRAFHLVAFGGAASLHACELAELLGMTRVLIPKDPGVLSAAGMASAPASRDYVTTVRRADPPAAVLRRLIEPFRRRGLSELGAEGLSRRRVAIRPFAQMRYLGQAHEIEVPLGPDYRARFDAAHARLYGHADAERSVEVLALRVEAVGIDDPLPRRRPRPRRRPAPKGERRPLTWRGRRTEVARIERDGLLPGTHLRGPVLVVEYSSTLLIPPSWSGDVDADGHLHLVRGRA